MPGTTETSSRLNFNPDWMSGGGKSPKYPFSSNSTNSVHPANNNDTVLAPPKLSKNRYSREELLVMFNLSSPAPSRLKSDFSDFYVDPAQNPVCMAPYTDIEQQLLVHGINSSKAISKVERSAHPQPPPATNSRWSNLHSSPSGGGPSGSRGFGRGAGGTAESSFGPPRPSRGFGMDRNAGGIGRGKGADTRLGPPAAPPPSASRPMVENPTNPRAQGLYDPNNPKDRPRQRLKSENEDHKPQQQYHSQVQQTTSSNLPEWVEEEEAEKPNLVKTGSFDETGNFRREISDQNDKIEKEQPITTRRIPQTFSTSVKEKTTLDDHPVKSDTASEETKPFLSTTTAVEQPRFLQFLKTPVVKQENAAPEPQQQLSAESLRLLKTPSSSSKTEDDVLSDLHTRAEGMIKSVFTEEAETVISDKFNHLLVANGNQQLAAQAPQVLLEQKRKTMLDSTWYYKDPSDTCQGPFSSEMMANWFAAGYFTMQLMIRPSFEPNFTSLGDMIKRVGCIPFQPPPNTNNMTSAMTAATASNFSSTCNTGATSLDNIFPQQQPLVNNSIPGQQPSTIWDVYNNSGTNYGLNPVNKQNDNIIVQNNNIKESLPATKEAIERDLQKMLERLKAEDKKRQDEEMERQKALQAEMARMLEEERKKMQELQMKLERDALEKERLLKEAEAKLKAQLEIQQAEEKSWKTADKQQPNVWGQKEPVVPVRATDVEAWLQSSATSQQDKKAAKMRKEEERRQKLEQEEQMRRDKEERLKEEQRLAAEAKMKAQEEERKRIYKEQMEKELKEQHRRLLEEERRKNKKLVPKSGEGAPAWGARAGGAGSSTLRDIQLEEERQMLAERRQNMELEMLNKPASPVQRTSTGAAGAWGRGSAPIVQPPPSFRDNPILTSQSKNAWNSKQPIVNDDLGVAAENFSSIIDDDRRKSPMKPMTFENKIYKRQDKQTSKNAAAPSKKSQPETTVKSSNEAIKRLLTQPNDDFALWCIEQMKKLNKEIADSEASVFIEFLRNVPDLEVKDYVLGYVQETPATNKFLNEFIEKRQRLNRLGGSTNVSLNEWSTVNKQNHGSGNDATPNLQHNNGKTAQGGKKKGKKGGVLDHAILGFKATGDPNRVNVGEIDSPM